MASKAKKNKEFQQIRVFLRTRPLNKNEVAHNAFSVIDTISNSEIMVRQPNGKRFKFNKVFGPSSTQLDVYYDAVAPSIPEVLAGYNCTIFAYGQTGTGKTYTMEGGYANNAVSWRYDKDAGCIPRAGLHLFDELENLENTEYTVQVSYTELYNEEIIDLLGDADNPQLLRIYEDPRQKGSVYISGLNEITVSHREDFYKLLAKGAERKKIAFTLMNDHSSRSHTVFTITVNIKETTIAGDYLVKTGKLNLVDLAGSENIGRSGAKDARAREASSINQSLLTLGRVMKALVEGNQHIPYRESKLTRILQDSLGGCTKTSIIATISPANSSLEETLNTLDYANRARNITNTPQINAKISQASLMKNLKEEVEMLKRDLQAQRSGKGVYIDPENYEKLVTENKDTKKRVVELKIDFQNLEERYKELMEQFRGKESEVKKEKFVARCLEKSNEEMSGKAKELLTITDHTAKSVNILHNKIELRNSALEKNNKIYEKVLGCLNENVNAMEVEIDDFVDKQKETGKDIEVSSENLRTSINDLFQNITPLKKLLDDFGVIFSAYDNSDSKMDFNNQFGLHSKMKNKIDQVKIVQNKFLASIKLTISTLKKIVADDANKLFSADLKEMENIAQATSELLANLGGINETITGRMSSLDRCVEDSVQPVLNILKTEHDKFVEDVQALEKVLANLKDSIENHAQSYKYLDEFRANYKRSISECYSKADEITTLSEKYGKELDGFKKYVNESKKLKTEHAKAASRQVSNLKRNTEENGSKIKTFADEAAEYNESNKEISLQMQMDIESFKINLLASNPELEPYADKIFSYQDGQMKLIKKIQENTKCFHQRIKGDLEACRELKEKHQPEQVLHEGDTPKREPLKYPKLLLEKVPKRESLLAKYREDESNKENAPDYLKAL